MAKVRQRKLSLNKLNFQFNEWAALSPYSTFVYSIWNIVIWRKIIQSNFNILVGII